jgi:hypothetical protein
MRDPARAWNPGFHDTDWRDAVVEAQRAQQAYVEHVQQSDDDVVHDKLWLRLWRADRLRDEIFVAGAG